MTRSAKGNGSITSLPDGRWLVKIPVGKYPKGTTRYVTEKCRTKSEANRVHARLLAERENQSLVAGPRHTFRQYATEVLNAGSDRVSERTLDGYLRTLRKHVFPVLGTRVLTDIKPYDLERLLNAVRKTHSASTVNNIRTAVSKVFAEALRHELVLSNPVARTQKARRQEYEPTQVRLPWTEEEVRHVLDAVNNSPLRAILTLDLMTGMRLGELQGLRWSDIDFEARTLSVERTLSHVSLLQPDGSTKRVVSVRPPKTASSRRVIQLTSPVLDALALHREEQELARLSAGPQWQETDYVFTNQVGGPLDESNFRKRFKRFLAKNGIREIRIHDMRHSFATILVERDSGFLPAVSKALGHSSLAITMDIYANTARVETQATSEMSEILFPGRTEIAPSQVAEDAKDRQIAIQSGGKWWLDR
jgi:integrase